MFQEKLLIRFQLKDKLINEQLGRFIRMINIIARQRIAFNCIDKLILSGIKW